MVGPHQVRYSLYAVHSDDSRHPAAVATPRDSSCTVYGFPVVSLRFGSGVEWPSSSDPGPLLSWLVHNDFILFVVFAELVFIAVFVIEFIGTRIIYTTERGVGSFLAAAVSSSPPPITGQGSSAAAGELRPPRTYHVRRPATCRLLALGSLTSSTRSSRILLLAGRQRLLLVPPMVAWHLRSVRHRAPFLLRLSTTRAVRPPSVSVASSSLGDLTCVGSGGTPHPPFVSDCIFFSPCGTQGGTPIYLRISALRPRYEWAPFWPGAPHYYYY